MEGIIKSVLHSQFVQHRSVFYISGQLNSYYYCGTSILFANSLIKMRKF